jgi:hypothetical protein
VRVEPIQLIRRTSANGFTEDGFVRVQNGELSQEFFGFAESVSLFEDDVAANGARYRRDKFYLLDLVQRWPDAADSRSSQRCLGGESRWRSSAWPESGIEPVDEDVGVNIRNNESGHG